MPMGSGGGGGGGAVVGGPTPIASLLAGQYQVQAADAAARAATQQTNDAIALLRQQYTSAFQSLKPYTSEGINALSELNKYMGLNQYNPGTAPTTPVMKTAQDFLTKVRNADIMNYIQSNTSLDVRANRGGQSFVHPYYTGEGLNTNDPSDLTGMRNYFGGGYVGPNSTEGAAGVYSGRDISTGNMGGLAGIAGVSALASNPDIKQAARLALARQMADQANVGFDERMAQYNQEMDLYNQAKGLYDAAPTPYTAEQVQEKLMAQPGVAFQYNQGLDAIQRAASAKGQIGSGRVLQALADYGQGMASQQYGATLQRLAGLVEMGNSAAGGQASLAQQLGNNAAQLTSGLGDTLANSFLAKGNALAQSTLAGNQQYKVIGGDSGGGGMGGLGSLLGGAASLMGRGSGGGSGLLGMFSDRKLKDIIAKPSTQEILENVKKLNIDRWKYKGLEAEHIGPYADEFKDHFGIGDGKTINIIDYLGVLTASIKELAIKLDRIETRIK